MQGGRLIVRKAALRWLMHHSLLVKKNGIILGASSKAQLEANLHACEADAPAQPLVDAFEHLSQEYDPAGEETFYSV